MVVPWTTRDAGQNLQPVEGRLLCVYVCRFGGAPPLLGSTSTSAAVQVVVSSAAPVAWMVLGAVLLAGRLLAGAVELWVIQRHMRGMLIADAAHASMQRLQRQ